MKNIFLSLVTFSLLIPAFAQEDIQGSKDHPLFNRMNGFYITEYEFEEFGSYRFYKESGEEVIAEGKKTYIYYESKEDVATLKIIRNYSNAIKKIGGTSYEYSGSRAWMNYKKGNYEIWAEVYAGGYHYTLTVVEIGEVEQEINATSLYEQLNTTGKAVLYINFETGKSVILPVSKKTIDEIVSMMTQNPDLKISVEGHTDNAGTETSNQKLSEERARSVADAIIAGKIDKSRLQSKGFGEMKPIAGNNTEEGRAKNRRVELIKI
jgi:outer membrane protein OmpA-like peptidoglycan-associated protein